MTDPGGVLGDPGSDAAMKPGAEAPGDYRQRDEILGIIDDAAMKPGAEAPGDQDRLAEVTAERDAAMKPGAEAPGDRGGPARRHPGIACRNEAGGRSPR